MEKSSLDTETIQKHNSYETRSEEVAVDAPPAPPSALPGPFDSGWLPWLQVVGSFAAWMNSWGLYNAFGEFQTYYLNTLLVDKSAEQIAWIGSLQAFLLLFLGPLTGILYDRGYFRQLMIVGNFLVVFGMMMTSLCTQYWQFILTQGLITGSGFGLLFVPCTAFIPQWFNKHRSLANGLAASGSGFGGVLYTVIFRTVEPQLGFSWATRIISFTTLLMAIVMLVTVQSKTTKTSKPRALIQWQAFTEKPYSIYGLALILAFLGIYTPWFFIGQYSLSQDSVPANISSYLVILINAGSAVGRISLSFAADKIGVIDVAAISLLCSGILVLCWIAIKSSAGLIVFALLYGVSAGSFLGICALVTVPLTKDLSTLGTRIGQLCMLGAIAVLIGTPISGAILAGGKGFMGLQVFSGVVMLCAAFAVLVVRITLSRTRRVMNS